MSPHDFYKDKCSTVCKKCGVVAETEHQYEYVEGKCLSRCKVCGIEMNEKHRLNGRTENGVCVLVCERCGLKVEGHMWWGSNPVWAYDPNEIQQEKLCFCMICGKKNPEGKHNWRTVTEGDYTNLRICTNCGERDESKKITLKEKAEKEAETQSRYKEAMINADSLHEMRAHGIKC